MFATGEAHEVYKSFPRRDVDGFLRISGAAYSSSQVGSRYLDFRMMMPCLAVRLEARISIYPPVWHLCRLSSGRAMEEGLPYRSDTPAVQISQTKYRIVTTLQRHIADDYYYGTSPSRGECVVTSSSLSVVMRMKLTNIEQLLNILCVMTQSSGVVVLLVTLTSILEALSWTQLMPFTCTRGEPLLPNEPLVTAADHHASRTTENCGYRIKGLAKVAPRRTGIQSAIRRFAKPVWVCSTSTGPQILPFRTQVYVYVQHPPNRGLMPRPVVRGLHPGPPPRLRGVEAATSRVRVFSVPPSGHAAWNPPTAAPDPGRHP
ncbi:hypothetical protein VTO73DRAFT_5927 [Trametes versicolor]